MTIECVVGSHPLLYCFDLEKSSERSPADRAIVSLVSQRVRTRVAQAEMSAWQNQSVSDVAHADHTFTAIVIGFIINRNLVQSFVLNAIDLLEQIAKTVHEDLLLQSSDRVGSICVMVNDADGGVRMLGVFVAFFHNTVNSNWIIGVVLVERQVIFCEQVRVKDVGWLGKLLIVAFLVVEGFRCERVFWNQCDTAGRNLLRTEVVNCDCNFCVRVEGELDVVGVLRRRTFNLCWFLVLHFHKSHRFLANVDKTFKSLGWFVGLRRGVRKLESKQVISY